VNTVYTTTSDIHVGIVNDDKPHTTCSHTMKKTFSILCLILLDFTAFLGHTFYAAIFSLMCVILSMLVITVDSWTIATRATCATCAISTTHATCAASNAFYFIPGNSILLHFLNDTGILATFIQRGLEQNASFARSIQLVPRNWTKKI